MRQDLEMKLVEDFPILYDNYGGDYRETCMHWGFEINDGWFDLVYKLSKELTELIEKEPEETRSKYTVAQVKQKFGGLRFYMDKSTKEMRDLISKAEEESYTICDNCGAPGKLKPGSWLSTLCEDHSKKGI